LESALLFAVLFAWTTIINAAAIAVGARLAGRKDKLPQILAIAAVGAALSFIPLPYVGWILSIAVMLYLMDRWLKIDPFPAGALALLAAYLLILLTRGYIVAAVAAALD
jgi:hypothetical protein